MIDIVESVVRKEPIDFKRALTNSERSISPYIVQMWLSNTNEFEYLEFLNETSNRLLNAFQDDSETGCKFLNGIVQKNQKCEVKFTKTRKV